MRVFPRWLAGVWLLLAGFPLLAQELALYEGEVAVPSQSESDRNAALPQALAQVLVKVGGDAGPAAAATEADAARCRNSTATARTWCGRWHSAAAIT